MTTATKKSSSSIWITSLCKLIAGDNKCEWASWFKTHYIYEKIVSNFDTKKWTSEHSKLLDERVTELESHGFTVYIENENYFEIIGKNKITKVAGKPDLVAIKDGLAIVEDCKTGREKNSDAIQVMLYMLLLPAPGGPAHCKGLKLEGQVVYNHKVVYISSTYIDKNFQDYFRRIVGSVGGLQPARKVPSFQECRFCDISENYCMERVIEKPFHTTEEHDLF